MKTYLVFLHNYNTGYDAVRSVRAHDINAAEHKAEAIWAKGNWSIIQVARG